MHPDIEKALKLLTQHAAIAQAKKSFGHLMPKDEEEEHTHADLESKIPGTTEVERMEAPHAAIDESAKNVMLAHDGNHVQEEIEDDFGDVPSGETSEEESNDEGEHLSKSLGIMSTVERGASRPVPNAPVSHGIHETAKRRRGRPRKAHE